MSKNESEQFYWGDIIWSENPASEWAEAYPIGNGRIGGMVMGGIYNERISLNHDLLWRSFWKYQKHGTAADITKIRDCCLKGQWDEADEIILRKVPTTGKAVYINPYVPAGDLYIDMYHQSGEASGYRRMLDMDKGIVYTEYCMGDVKFLREVFCSWEKGVMIIRLTANRAGLLSGEVSLSRINDPECIVTGYSLLDKVVMDGRFEEGNGFTAAAKIMYSGGRLTGGKKEYQHVMDSMPEKDFGLKYRFSKNEMYSSNQGVSTCFDSCDEVMILVSVAVDDEVEKGMNVQERCLKKLDDVSECYEALRKQHLADHREIYRKVRLRFSGDDVELPMERLFEKASAAHTVSPELLEKSFNLSRYLAISSGRPQPVGEPPKPPINLQGIWNQDRRPAWDCDYHLDLNLEMCYWPLDMLNLGGLIEPLMTWVERIMEDGRTAAKDLYGCDGIAFTCVCDYKNIGNVDTVLFCWTGAAAWIAQILWQHWEYDCNEEFLREHLFPFMLEIGRFYEGFLYEDDNGYLLPSLSASPEMPISGRRRGSFCSTASTMDLELIRDLFTHLIEAGLQLGTDPMKIKQWEKTLDRVPLPRIDDDGCLCEWLGNHVPGDPGHRHRSHMVGLCPGDRITQEDTPEYAEAAYKALKLRHKHGADMTQSLTFVWDAQILARLLKGEEVYEQLERLFYVHVLNNLLITCNDWEGNKGGLAWFKGIKLFQIEANIAVAAPIIEMIFQDRNGLMRFLPALPEALNKGILKGIRAKGGFEVDIEWDRGELIDLSILSLNGNECKIKNHMGKFGNTRIYCDGKVIPYDSYKHMISFKTEAGDRYMISFG